MLLNGNWLWQLSPSHNKSLCRLSAQQSRTPVNKSPAEGQTISPDIAPSWLPLSTALIVADKSFTLEFGG
jgi:hypothetical protein